MPAAGVQLLFNGGKRLTRKKCDSTENTKFKRVTNSHRSDHECKKWFGFGTWNTASTKTGFNFTKVASEFRKSFVRTIQYGRCNSVSQIGNSTPMLSYVILWYSNNTNIIGRGCCFIQATRKASS